MARRHLGLPRPLPVTIRKVELLQQLQRIDTSQHSTARVLAMETAFRAKIRAHIASLPGSTDPFQEFSTNPFVLMIQCSQHRYERISQIEHDILPAKQFSSMETSAGRMVEEVVLPVYGWQAVPSAMHTANSALDGKRIEPGRLLLATLKSGPCCLNDEMAENFADAILANFRTWADTDARTVIDFTYGVLYGTPKQSNKKDWHILRNIAAKLPGGCLGNGPQDRWSCDFLKDGVRVEASVRIGVDWWFHLGGPDCLCEVCIALVRACVQPGVPDPPIHVYTISDLGQIASTAIVPGGFNVSILQVSQLPWLFFLIRHFCDVLED